MKERADMESLGVETPDENTLIFHLSKPCVYFLELLRLPVYTPSCSKYAKETGSGWDKKSRDQSVKRTVLSGKICTRAIFCPEKE